MERPWKESRGPIVATESDLRKAEAVNVHLVRPIDILPSNLGDPILPFAIGLWPRVRVHLKPNHSATAQRRALGAYSHTKRYYSAVAQKDSMRHDINGRPIEAVSIEDRLAAQRSFRDMNLKETVESEPAVEPAPSVNQLSKAELIRASLLKRT